MSFRNLDANWDWVYGQGVYSYVTGNEEISLNIRTRILSFLGDCFFATDEGIDWWNLLDYNKQEELENDIKEVIKNTDGVIAVETVDAVLGADRKLSLTYTIQTIYSSSYSDEINFSEVLGITA